MAVYQLRLLLCLRLVEVVRPLDPMAAAEAAKMGSMDGATSDMEEEEEEGTTIDLERAYHQENGEEAKPHQKGRHMAEEEEMVIGAVEEGAGGEGRHLTTMKLHA